jgi:hypothetical protein
MRWVAVVAIVLVVALIFWLMWRGWRRRTERDAELTAPFAELPTGAHVTARFSGLYVATTAHDEPLERLAIGGLAFRSTMDLTVTDAGAALDLPGLERVLFTPERILAVDQATVAIDRVVEKDGMVRIVWKTPQDVVVDTYLRAQDASARQVADAVRAISPTASTSDGSDA